MMVGSAHELTSVAPLAIGTQTKTNFRGKWIQNGRLILLISSFDETLIDEKYYIVGG